LIAVNVSLTFIASRASFNNDFISFDDIVFADVMKYKKGMILTEPNFASKTNVFASQFSHLLHF
jgi:hypothetical protein